MTHLEWVRREIAPLLPTLDTRGAIEYWTGQMENPHGVWACLGEDCPCTRA